MIVTDEAVDKAMDIYYGDTGWRTGSDHTGNVYRKRMKAALVEATKLCEDDRTYCGDCNSYHGDY